MYLKSIAIGAIFALATTAAVAQGSSRHKMRPQRASGRRPSSST